MNRFDVVVSCLDDGATVAVVDAGAPRNAPARHMQGFLSRDGLPPQDLLDLGRDEVTSYGGTLIDGSVAAATRCADPGFEVRLDNGSVLAARRLLVATGLHDVLPDIPGVRERWGCDLLHCPYCHGYEVRDQPLGVLGGTDEAVQHAQLIRQWSSDVVLFPHTDMLTAPQREQLAAREIGVVEGTVQRLVVDEDQLTGVFVRPRFVPSTDLLVSLGCDLDDEGWVRADAMGRTSVPGVSVAGNVANPRAQVITAAGEGSAAAIALNADLMDDDVHIALTAKES